MDEDGLLESALSHASALPIDDAAMEDVIDKLKMLDYETDFCVRHPQFRMSRSYFSRPSPTPSEQFFAFTSLVAWLLQVAGERFAAPSQFDDAGASATSILSTLKSLGFPVKEIAPGKLRLGHGEAVLHVLNVLCDKALLLRGFQFRTPEWVGDQYDDELNIDEGPQEDAPEDIASDVDESEALVDAMDVPPTKDLIIPEANPAEWAEEATRVAPLLKLTWKNEFRDWRSHLAWTQSLLRTIEKTFPGVKLALESTSETIGKAMATIQKRELGLVEHVTPKIDQFRVHKKEFNAIAEKYRASAEGVNVLSNELNQVTEVLESLKAEIATREEAMQDTSSLGKIKEAMGAIKTEISDMELKIGVYQHQMMHYHLKNPGKAALEVTEDEGSDSDPEDWH